MPETVRQYLSNMNIVLFNFNFIPFKKLPLIHDFYLWINFDHYNEDFKEIGVDSGSTVVNNISTIVILILFAIIHMIIALIYCSKRSKTDACGKITRAAWKVMNFTTYIRLLLENMLYMMLCSFSELYGFDTLFENRRTSLVIAFLFIILCFAFYVFIIYQFRATKLRLKRVQYAYSEELFAGLKESNTARTYSVLFATRRLIICIFLVCLQDLHFLARVVLFSIIQIVYLI